MAITTDMTSRFSQQQSHFDADPPSPPTPITGGSIMSTDEIEDSFNEPIAFNVSDNYAIHDIIGEGAYGVVV
jgi:hypothetical protein